jgi:urease accessory protein
LAGWEQGYASVLQPQPWLPRTQGVIGLTFARQGERTRLNVLRQSGAGRVRFPKGAEGAPPEAVLLNTAGGLTGGDTFHVSVALRDATQVTVTTAAAEKIYRARDGHTVIRVAIDLANQARLTWLPQPTILFDRARLDRRTAVELAGDASLLAIETLIFGRTAMGEHVQSGACHDALRIKRSGKLIYADAFSLAGAIGSTLARSATLQDARALATLVYVAPDSRFRLDATRALLENASSTAGVSAWNDLLHVRAFAKDGRTLLADLRPVIEYLSGRPCPRVWQC